MFELLKNERFSIFFSGLIFILAVLSAVIDLYFPNEIYWFQRAGALVVLAGVELQYSNLISVWKKAVNREKEIESVESRIESGKGVSMLEMAKESEKTRAFALRIHDTVTAKNPKDTIALFFIILGTVIWGYGDLPFK